MDVSCVAADTLCSIRIIDDMAAKKRQAETELVNSGRLFSKDIRLRRRVVIVLANCLLKYSQVVKRNLCCNNSKFGLSLYLI